MANADATTFNVIEFISQASHQSVEDLQEALNMRRVVLNAQAQRNFPSRSPVSFEHPEFGKLIGYVVSWHSDVGKANVRCREGKIHVIEGLKLKSAM